jgi:hypothetical protein
LVAAGPASAASSNCASGRTCAWDDANYVTSGNGAALVWFEQCVSDYTVLKYAGTNTLAGYPGGPSNYWPTGNSQSIYNNGNYQTVTMMNAALYDTYYGSYRIAKKTGDPNIDDSSGPAQRWSGWGPVSGIFDTVSKSCRN